MIIVSLSLTQPDINVPQLQTRAAIVDVAYSLALLVLRRLPHPAQSAATCLGLKQCTTNHAT
jgi:hypothetical protein